MIRSILLPIDGSTYSKSVLEYGIHLGKALNATLRVLTVVDIRLYEWNLAAGNDSFVPVVTTTAFQEETQQMLKAKAKAILEKAEDMLKKTGLSYETDTVDGIPADEISDRAKISDLVILGIRGEYERWGRHDLGATVEVTARQISKPVLLVDKTFTPFKRILCGYNGSDAANRALQLSAFLSKELQMLLQVVVVSSSEEERSALLNEAGHYLEPYEIEFQLRHETEPSAVDALINARNNAPFDVLLSIGSFGHSRLREAILGSTTVQLMRKAAKPILLAR